MTHKLYDLLGLQPGSSKDDIKRSFKKLAVTMHPDKGGDPDKFKEIVNAYEVLSDDNQRQQYDMFGDDGPQEHRFNFNPMADLFQQFFNHPMQQRHTQTTTYTVQISLKEAYTGVKKTIKVSSDKMCDSCRKKCPHCNGTGARNEMQNMGFIVHMLSHPCEACNGKGQVASGCSSCKNGKVRQERLVHLDIPAGVDSNATLAVGQDFVVHVTIANDPNFKRDNLNLVYTKKISLKDSIVGVKFVVPHFDSSLEFNTADWGIVRGDKKYRVIGKGFLGRGDLVIEFEIEYPKLTEHDRTILAAAFSEVGK